MSKSFAQIFRASKFATYDPTLKQVYTSYGPAKKVGEWGLKRNLPKTWRSPVITVKAMDTVERQTPFDSALNEVLFLKRWNANFGNHSRMNWDGFSKDRKIDLMGLSDKEFNNLVELAKECKQEFQLQYKKSDNQQFAINEFLNLYDGQKLDVKAPPMYTSTYGEKKAVKGRVLGKVRFGGYSIGVNGVVSSLSKAATGGHSNQPRNRGSEIDLNPFNHEVREFHVNEAYFDNDNVPQVTLALNEVNHNQNLTNNTKGRNQVNIAYFSKLMDTMLHSGAKNDNITAPKKSKASFLRIIDSNTQNQEKSESSQIIADMFKAPEEPKN